MDNRHKIVNYLGKNIGKGCTMRQLSQLIRIPYASFYRTVHKMTDILTINTIGKSKTLSLNFGNSIVKSHLTVASDEERKEFLKRQPVIRKIAGDLETKDIVILFGSYAKGKQTERSDIDILVINNRGKRSLSFSKYELLYRKKINPIFITKNEFKKMLKDTAENVGKQALKDHIIINNPEKFWECVLNGI
jgi:predicted nucleotidyltransferase